MAEGELFSVLGPREEGFPRGASVRVRIRLDAGARLRRAELNGVGVRRLLGASRGGRLLQGRLERGEVKALRRGRNFLHVVAAAGKQTERETVPFTLVRRSPKLVRRLRVRYERDEGLRVALRFSKLHGEVHARLNERGVGSSFGNGHEVRRLAVLGAGAGLRHGRNVLRIRATHFHGAIRRFKRTVVVPRGVTIAGAGPDRRLAAGEAAQLDGSASLPALGSNGKPAAGGLRYSWSIARAPRGSRARLAAADGPRPVLHTDLPGSYRLRLATTMAGAPPGDSSTTSVDTTEVNAGSQPFAAVDTMATVAGKSGILIEGTRECESGPKRAEPPCFYPNPGSDEDLQVVVLDRSNLSEGGEAEAVNVSYSEAELGEFAEAMAELVEPTRAGSPPAYETKKLVLVALRSGSLADEEQLAEGLGIFNVNEESEAVPLEGLGSSPFSLIAVPGTLEGRAAINLDGATIEAPDGSKTAPGGLTGFFKLVADSPGVKELELDHSFAWPDAIPFDTRAAEGTAFRLGGNEAQIVPSWEAPGSDGFAVFTFDPVNPNGTLERTAFATNAASPGTNSGLDWSLLASELKKAAEANLGVALVSSGDIGGFASEPDADSFLAVQEQLEALGVNPDVFARAVSNNGAYSMISSGERPGAANVPGQVRAGYSASSAIAEGVKEPAKLGVAEGRLTGVLQRASYGALFPSTGDPSGSPPEAEMLQVANRKQVAWQLTPATAAAAGCQAVAFAYVSQVIGISSASELPLWSGEDASACEKEEHEAPSPAAQRRADNLEGDGCAKVEATAAGANSANVRAAALKLRAKYQDTSKKFDSGQIESVLMPAGAPFTEKDLICAKNQMLDEVADREETIAYLGELGQVQYVSQKSVVTELATVAKEIESAMLAKLKGELRQPSRMTSAMWAGFTLQILGAVAKITAVGAGSTTLVGSTAQIFGQMAGVGQGIASVVQAEAGNPVDLTDKYLLLAAQLHEEEIEVDRQVEEMLLAQERGALLTQQMLLADPAKMAEVSVKNAVGQWEVGAAGLLRAQNAYMFRVRQMAYQAYWPQVYSGARVNFKNLCQAGATEQYEVCWNGGEWTGGEAQRFTNASQTSCLGADIYGRASPGSPPGLGEGNEWQPRSIPGPEGQRPALFLDYVMVSTSNLRKGKVSIAESSAVAPFFAQPADNVQEPATGAAPPGFYAPEFWWQNLELDKRIVCDVENFEVKEESTGGLYEDVEEENELWPTPPRSFCAKEPGDSSRTVCTYGNGYFRESALDLATLVEGLGGDTQQSGIWLAAFGGSGSITDGQPGGENGVARTYYESAGRYAQAFGSPAIHYYLGAGGERGTGAGGAATLIAGEDVSAGTNRTPCILKVEGALVPGGGTVTVPKTPDDSACAKQNVVLLAAGGGGRGKSDGGWEGKNGGYGGKAVATTQSMSAGGARGNSYQGSHRSNAGFNGEGGLKSSKGGGHPGGNGIGGMGGQAGDAENALWTNGGGFYGAEAFGVGGEDGSGNGGHGGGGGGGFGGGGGGGSGGDSGTNVYGGSGGAGGGSFAYGGDAPPASGVPSFEPPGEDGALVIVVDDVSGTSEIDAVRSCAVRRRGVGRATIVFRNLKRRSLRASRCSTARSLVGAAAARPARMRFEARGFDCRSRAVRRGRPARRWVCTYGRGELGYAKVKFTEARRRRPTKAKRAM